MHGSVLEVTPCPLCEQNSFLKLIEIPFQHGNSKGYKNLTFVRCKSCDLIYLNPRIPQSEISSYYSDDYPAWQGPELWGKYEKFVRFHENNLNQKRVNEVLARTVLGQKQTLVDMGCGRPSFLKMLVEKTKVHAIGIDFSDSGWTEKYKNLDLRKGDHNRLLSTDCPDVVTMWHFLEHDYNPLETLSSIRKKVKKDCLLLIEVPDYVSFSRKIQGPYWGGYHPPFHTMVFTRHTLISLLSKTGWALEDWKPSGTLDPWILWWLGWQNLKSSKKRASGRMQNLESQFLPFLTGKVLSFPLFSVGFHSGIQLVAARAS